MDRRHVLQLLGEHKPHLAEKYGVTELAVFGSMARNAAAPDSDIDGHLRSPRWAAKVKLGAWIR